MLAQLMLHVAAAPAHGPSAALLPWPRERELPRTTWRCTDDTDTGSARLRSCEFSNLYRHNGTWYALVDDGSAPPEVQLMSKHENPSRPSPVSEAAILRDVVAAGTPLVVHAGAHLHVKQLWLHNIGHALFDGLFASWVAMLLTLGRAASESADLRFAVLLESSPGWRALGVPEQLPPTWTPEQLGAMVEQIDLDAPAGRRYLVHDALDAFGGNGCVRSHDLAQATWHRFERIVMGAGLKGQRSLRPDGRMAGYELDALRSFRDRLLRGFGIESAAHRPARSRRARRVAIFDNKRYTAADRREIGLVTAAARRSGFSVEYVEWEHIGRDSSSSGRESALRAQLRLVASLAVYVTSWGTGMMLA